MTGYEVRKLESHSVTSKCKQKENTAKPRAEFDTPPWLCVFILELGT